MNAKLIRPLFLTICTLAMAEPALQAASVVLNIDSSFEGLADSRQNPLTQGMFKIGWFDADFTEAEIKGYFETRNFAAIDAKFHNVVSILDLNTYGPGLPYQSFTLVADGDVAGLEDYTNAVTGAAGKQIYGWILSDPSGTPSESLQQAILTSSILFPTAADDIYQSDYEATFGTDSYAPEIDLIIGEIQPIIPGSGVDAGGGVGLNGGSNVLTTWESIPEPNSSLLIGIGVATFALFRRKIRNAR